MSLFTQMQSYVDQFAAVSDLAAADKLLKMCIKQLGFTRFTYTYNSKKSLTKPLHECCSDNMLTWQHYFLEEGFESIDPVGKRVRESILPLLWDLRQELQQATGRAIQLFEAALQYGLSVGLSVPIHGPDNAMAIFVIHDERLPTVIASGSTFLLCVQSLLFCYHEAVMRLLVQKHTESGLSILTKRELACLQLTAENKSAKEVAACLDISVRTVGFHIENINKKLRVKTKFQAVQKALHEGWLDV